LRHFLLLKQIWHRILWVPLCIFCPQQPSKSPSLPLHPLQIQAGRRKLWLLFCFLFVIECRKFWLLRLRALFEASSTYPISLVYTFCSDSTC
jgi:hypothetical protein